MSAFPPRSGEHLKRAFFSVLGIICLFLGGCSLVPGLSNQFSALLPGSSTSDGIYVTRSVHDPDGIGKFYMGREIAQVMGHQGAYWLERSSRTWEEKPLWAVAALDLQPDDVVADIGAGTGFLSFRIAERYPSSTVYAVDLQPEMVELLQERAKDMNSDRVIPQLGSETDVNLADGSVDVAIMLDAYHEFEYPREMMESVVRALKPDGKVVLVEYRKENPLIAIKGAHKMSQRQTRKEMRVVGLQWRETKDLLPKQHFMVFDCKPDVCGNPENG